MDLLGRLRAVLFEEGWSSPRCASKVVKTLKMEGICDNINGMPTGLALTESGGDNMKLRIGESPIRRDAWPRSQSSMRWETLST